MLCAFVFSVKAQNISFNEVLVDGSGQINLSDAVDKLKTRNKETNKRFDGEFTLEDVTRGAVLIISNLGFGKRKISINNSTEYNIELQKDQHRLKDEVKVGYRKNRKKNIPVLFYSINPENIKDIVSINIAQALQVKCLGVNAKPQSLNFVSDDDLTFVESTMKIDNVRIHQ